MRQSSDDQGFNLAMADNLPRLFVLLPERSDDPYNVRKIMEAPI